jgi:anti-sigma regulatory factor (Ser/Thr protein kinase)
MYVPMNPERWGGASWAVPLWSERGLIGVLLLGEKLDGGLYAQEEIEIARATGERLIDTQASAQLAQRLMHLQRQRLAESQVLDRRARRVLHDDVLPLLHTALLELMTEEGSVKTAGRKPKATQTGVIDADDSRQAALGNLSQAHHLISDLLRDMPSTAAPEIGRLGLVGALRKVVNEEFATAFDSVEWKVDAQAQERASDISPLSAEVLYYAAREAIRNSARYARHDAHGEQGRPLHLKIAVLWHDGLEIVVEDDGAGIAGGRLAPDDSDGTNGSGPHSGSGQGLALHSTMMAVVGGSLGIESTPGEYTRVALSLPMGVDTSA